MDTIQVTLLLPVKNGEEHLQAAIAFLKANTKPSYEVLIIDDNSEDQTFPLLEMLCSNLLNFKVLRNPGFGLVDALNFGVAEAKGDWIARFDVDDSYAGNRIESQIALITENTVAIFSDYSFKDSSGRHLGNVRSAVVPFATELSVISAQRIAHPVAFLSREAIMQAGGYLHSEFPAEDLGLWMRMMKVGSFKSSPELLLKYRMSGGSITGSKRQQIFEARDKLLRKPSVFKPTIDSLNPTIMSIFAMYRNYDNYWERTLFYLRDLLIARNLCLLNTRQTVSTYLASAISVLNPFAVLLIAKHLYYQRLRNTLRKINSPNRT